MKADIFFFVTTVAVVLAFVVFLIIGLYIIGILRDFKSISDILRKGTEKMSGHMDDLAKNVEESFLFKFLFGKKKRKKKEKEE